MTSSPVTPQKSTFTKFVDTVQPFWIGGLSGVLATCVIQPVDMIKVVIQLKSEELAKLHDHTRKANFMSAFRDIHKSEGIKGFYRG